MSNVTILYVGVDTVLELDGFKNNLTGAFLNAATVTAILVDAEGNQVTGQSWPLTLTYVTSSDGTYRGVLPYTLGLVAGHRYTAQITASGGAGLRDYRQLACVARPRD